MKLERKGIVIHVDDNDAQQIVHEWLIGRGATQPVPDASNGAAVEVTPRIGQYWRGQGGIYAGVVRGRSLNEPDYHLIVGPELGDPADWDEMNRRAVAVVVDERVDFTLPYRSEGFVMNGNGNVPKLFRPKAYWLREQHEFVSNDAWGQYFTDGNQFNWDKSSELRGRAVRRLVIRSFAHFSLPGGAS